MAHMPVGGSRGALHEAVFDDRVYGSLAGLQAKRRADGNQEDETEQRSACQPQKSSKDTLAYGVPDDQRRPKPPNLHKKDDPASQQFSLQLVLQQILALIVKNELQEVDRAGHSVRAKVRQIRQHHNDQIEQLQHDSQGSDQTLQQP